MCCFWQEQEESDTGVSRHVGHAGSMQNSGRGLLPDVVRHAILILFLLKQFSNSQKLLQHVLHHTSLVTERPELI